MIQHWFSALPLRKKVIYPIWALLTISTIIIAASITHLIGFTQSENLYTRTSILTQGIASNLSAALIFNDLQTGIDQMNALSFDPAIIAAHVENADLESFAQLDKLPDNCQWDEKKIQCATSLFFTVTHPITLNDEHLGYLTVWTSKDKITKQLNQIITIFVISTAIFSILALFFAHRLHLLISTPLLSMLSSMQSVIKKGVTNKRLNIVHLDELGMVTNCFNDMLDNLSHRDTLLSQAFQHLEDKNHYINQVLDSLEQGLLVVSTSKEITYCNPATCQLLTYIKSNNNGIIAGQSIQFILRDFESNGGLLELENHIQKHQRLEPIILRHQMTEQLYQISTYPIVGNKNSLIHIEDVTARHIIEQRQRTAEMIFDQNQNSLLVLTRALKIETKNNTFVRTFGEIDTLKQLNLRQPIQFTFALFKQLISTGFFQIKTHVLRSTLGNDAAENSIWLPCLITIKTIKNSTNKVESFIISISDQSQKMELERLHFETNHDSLTGLANRRNAYQTLTELHQKENSLYVLFVDLDGFKAVNDTYGHQCGDELLKVIAQRLTHCVNQHDLVARLSGDEFLLGLLFSNQELEHNIPLLLKRILASINNPIFVKGNTIKVSASIGVYHWIDDPCINLEDALQKADSAMYLAKVAGKNRYCII